MNIRCMLVTVALLCPAGSAVSADRPNFVWLISEDNSSHFLKLYDEDGAETPNIAALAEHGLIYDHAFSNSPVCSVARTTLITGCYAPRIGTQFHRRAVEVPMPDGLRMFPAYLREAGYHTTNNAKKDYNATEGQGVWDASSPRASWRDRKDGQNFFHKRTFTVSHESSLHFGQAQMRNQPTRTDPDEVRLAPYHPDTPTFRYTHARYLDRMADMDRQVGTVVDQLREDGLLEDTFIFYFGDHGGVLPRGKGYAYETGLHIPLIVRVPERWKQLVGRDLGGRVSGFVSFIDFGPTLLHLAGLPLPPGIDGRPFLGDGIEPNDADARTESFGYADRFDEKIDLVRWLRDGRYTYVRSYQPFNFDGLQNNYRYRMLAYQEWRELYSAGELDPVRSQFFEPRPAEALFDIETDPYETVNLANEPEHQGTLARLRNRLAAVVKGMPDLSFYPESELATNAFRNPVAFGRERRDGIARLVDVADLQLVPFDQARPALERALASENPWERYWGLIACTAHGRAALALSETAEKLAKDDPERLVRVRAAEFLALAGGVDPKPVIDKALSESRSPIEVNLILNTVVLLRDGKPGYDITVDPGILRVNSKNNEVGRRLEYLSGTRDDN